MERTPPPSLNYPAMAEELRQLAQREPRLRAEVRRLTPRQDVILDPAGYRQLREARVAHEDAVILIRYYRSVLSAAGWTGVVPDAA